jgi:hypothetical protein
VPYIIRPRHMHRFVAGLFGAFLLIGAAPAAASTGCPPSATSLAFAKFGDKAAYTLVEGGLFESGAPGWSLDRAEVIAGGPEEENPSYGDVGYQARSSDASSHSLAIYRGGSGVSPPVCVDAEHPSFRFFSRVLYGWHGSLDVSLRWTDRRGTHETSDATLVGTRAWTVSPVLELASKLPATTTTNVRLVFQPTGGAFAIDDVYVDPYRR